MNFRRKSYCDIGVILAFLVNVDKNGVEVCDGEGRWVDSPDYAK